MSSFNNNQVNKLFPGLDKIMQGYTGSLNSEASVYGHSQPAGPAASTTQECVLSPATSSMALFAHHAQAAMWRIQVQSVHPAIILPLTLITITFL
ncbi:hypothetical protein DSO57_1010079 [Entomophthora muscae]|uniref:Uncharacterized protein n=1 Tax=Entomophthora muscae TaxID=34485 RepID=A0ACC2T6U7_9FUNG|nr:hypothetical protein DSO57_1010079 [Entomophthora muscae]